jgi:hypothetical protein
VEKNQDLSEVIGRIRAQGEGWSHQEMRKFFGLQIILEETYDA